MAATTVPNYQSELSDLRGNLTGMLPAESLKTFDDDANALQATHTNPLKLSVGDTAPPFTLPNAVGNQVSLDELLRQGRVVLTFYRGGWCPYCNLQLSAYQRILPELKARGAQLVAVSPQTPDESLNMRDKNNLEFEVLSDRGNQVAAGYTTIFTNGKTPVDAMTALGIDFDSFYADDSRGLPVPAVFIIEQDGSVSFAATTGGDYRNRVEPAAILEALG